MILETTETGKIRDKINEFAAKGSPFFFAVNYELSEGIFADDPLKQEAIYFSFNQQGNKPAENIYDRHGKINSVAQDPESYKAKFNTVREALDRGAVKVVNLTMRTRIEPDISCEEIFLRSNSPYQVYLPGRFVCFSPERFVHISDKGVISTNPMKGTIDASVPNAEQQILNDPKEIAEHSATVGLIADEFKSIASNVHITRFRYTDRIVSQDRTLLQVSSEVAGQLDKDYTSRMGDILFSLLPAGSVTGTPRCEAVRTICESEGENRGYYCGIAGYFDGRSLDTAVLIRFIEVSGEEYYFRSGGGVTTDSSCEQEYREVLKKIYLPF